MPLQRTGYSPPYVDFALAYVVDSPNAIPQPVSVLFPAGLSRLKIPTYQRGIEWDGDNFKSLLNSNSALFGTVILAAFTPPDMELVDGLQRFATVTALLECLFPRVLSPTPSVPTAAALPQFTALRTKAGGYAPLVNYNHNALMSHPRRAIGRGYQKLYDAIVDVTTSELAVNAISFAGSILQMLMVKQISIDPYYGFQQHIELAHTFLNMNSQGVDLSEVDLLRAQIVDQVIGLGWTPNQTAQMENSFSDTFEGSPNYKKQVEVFGTVLNSAFERHRQLAIFPNWANLQPADVQTLLTFVDSAVQSGASPNFPYLREIFHCGGYPFSILLLYFYLSNMSPGTPDFVSGTGASTTNLCHEFLRACYRRVIDGTIARTGDIADGMIDGAYTSWNGVLQAINPIGAGPLTGPPNALWLNQRLRQADIKRAQRIFNAMLLPNRANVGGPFVPLIYGKRTSTWNVDHLNASSLITANAPGEIESERLGNFAPLPSPTNTAQKNSPCSVKLGPHGTVSACVASMTTTPQYLTWLVGTHYPAHTQAELDNQAFLEPNAQPCAVGDERINFIASVLASKL